MSSKGENSLGGLPSRSLANTARKLMGKLEVEAFGGRAERTLLRAINCLVASVSIQYVIVSPTFLVGPHQYPLRSFAEENPLLLSTKSTCSYHSN